MIHIWRELDRYASKRIWQVDITSLGRTKAVLIWSSRIIYLVVRDLLDGQLSLRAMSLVYTTMLSLVPLLAVTFSVLKAFGVHNQIEPMLRNMLIALGPKGAEITSKVIGFVENTKVGVLGSVGLVLLIYFVVSLVQKVEGNLNFIWRVSQPRGVAQRFSEYISVILVGPVLVFAALGVIASISSTALVQRLLTVEAIGTIAYLAGRLIPYVLVCAAFTFFYVFIPNTRVRLRSALVGGTVAGVLWATVGWLFASFVATSGKYAAIYSSFAVLVLFMIWLYVSWYILLIGAQIAYYHQHPQTSGARAQWRHLLAGSMRERLALLIMYFVGYNHYFNKPCWTTETLAVKVGLEAEPVQTMLAELVREGFLVQTADEAVGYVPARDIETITLKGLLDAIRGSDRQISYAESVAHVVPQLDHIMAGIDKAIGNALSGQTLKQLVLGPQESDKAAPFTVDTRKTGY
jgi:membrane protein